MPKLITQIALGLWGITPGNYSAITPVGESTYAIVDDKDATDGYKLLDLQIDGEKGKVLYAQLMEPEGMALRRSRGEGTMRDCEGACYFPLAGTVFVSGETYQDILEYDSKGVPTGRQLAVPECMKRTHIASNQGFEALTYNAAQHRFWTTTEGALLEDASSPLRLRLLSFDDELQPSLAYVYQMDEPIKGQHKRNNAHGVASMLALDDGRLLVLEREAYSPKWKVGAFVNHKIYVVDPSKENPVSLDTPMADVTDEQVARKVLLAEFKTRLNLFRYNLANFEGMCLGPRLNDGRQILLLIADSQNGKGNFLYHLKDYIGILPVQL